MNPDHGNLFDDLPADLADEAFDVLFQAGTLTVERIVSRGHSSPTEGWYDQPRDEWVMVMSGAATVVFADGRTFQLAAGDYLAIAAHAKHRVTWTDPGVNTVWLALHFDR